MKLRFQTHRHPPAREGSERAVQRNMFFQKALPPQWDSHVFLPLMAQGS